ncbi:MAG: GyrI-like domain-containing protein [Spirochaetia bacterium]
MKIKKRKPKNTLAVNALCSVEELPMVLGESYGRIMQVMKEKKTFPSGAPFVIYKNDDMQALDLEIGFPVMKRVEGNGEVKAGILPGGVCAVARHKGPYSTIEKTYENLTAFIKEKGKNPSGICYEVYLNDPEKTKPEKLKTDVVFTLDA